MESSETKKCPFCAETILADAVKCRFCFEFLRNEAGGSQNPGEGGLTQLPVQLGPEGASDTELLFEGCPSLWAVTGAFFRASFFLAIAGLMMSGYTKDFFEFFDKNLSGNQMLLYIHNTQIAGIVLAGVVMMILVFKAVKLKSTRYEVTCDRIEWARGIFSRKIDNLDMFRVVDLRLHRSLFDCVVGVGTVTLITKDATDPEFSFIKVRNPRRLYNTLKKASMEADRRNSVIHIE